MRLVTVWMFFLSIACCGKAQNSKVVGYYTSWAQFRPGVGKFMPEDIDGNLLTHVVYAFAKLNANGDVVPAEHNDLSTAKTVGMYARFNQIKQRYPHLKTLLALGGSKQIGFAKFFSKAELRRSLAKSLVDFALMHGFDGVDIDWEVEQNQSAVHGCDWLLDFLNRLRTEAASQGRPDFIITVVVGKVAVARTAQCVAKVAKIADWLHVIGYDFHGDWDNHTGANSPLIRDHSDTSECYIDHLISNYLKRGVPPSKLVLAIPAYGRSYAQVNFWGGPGARHPSQGPGRPGEYTKSPGVLAFYEIEQLLTQKDWVKVWDEVTSTPYAYNRKNREWISFDDVKSLEFKKGYIKKKKLGGVALWALPMDDFRKGYPLLRAIQLT